MPHILILLAVLVAGVFAGSAFAAVLLRERAEHAAAAPVRRMSTFAEADTVRFLVTSPVADINPRPVGLARVPEAVSRALQLDHSNVDVVVQIDEAAHTGVAYQAQPDPQPAPDPVPSSPTGPDRPDRERGSRWDRRFVALFARGGDGTGQRGGAHRYGADRPYRLLSWSPLKREEREAIAPTYWSWCNGLVLGAQIVRDAVAGTGGRPC